MTEEKDLNTITSGMKWSELVGSLESAGHLAGFLTRAETTNAWRRGLEPQLEALADRFEDRWISLARARSMPEQTYDPA